jgi:hypothetical protein
MMSTQVVPGLSGDLCGIIKVRSKAHMRKTEDQNYFKTQHIVLLILLFPPPVLSFSMCEHVNSPECI